MKIEFINGEKVITHPTGVVSKYQQVDLEKRKADLQRDIQKNNSRIAAIEQDIIETQNSIGS